MRAGGFGRFHQRRNRPPGFAGLFRIDAVQTKHHRRVEHAAGIIADLITRARPGREVAVAGAIDKNIRSDRLPSGLGLDHQRVDAAFVTHHDARAERMKEDIDLVGGEQIVGRDLVGRGVVGLCQNLSENKMWRIQPVETIHARE